jgi:hypothetical protein
VIDLAPLVALGPVRVLFLCAQHLFVAGLVVWVHPGPACRGIGKSEHDGRAVRVRSREVFRGSKSKTPASLPWYPPFIGKSTSLSPPCPRAELLLCTKHLFLIVKAANALKVRSCLTTAKRSAVKPVFQKLRQRRNDGRVFVYAFDLLELDGQDVRREPLEVREATLASVLRECPGGVRLNEHLTHPGDIVFRHACAMSLEVIVSKRPPSRFTAGPSILAGRQCCGHHHSPDQNPGASAIRRRLSQEWHRRYAQE